MGADHPAGEDTGRVHGMCVNVELPTKEEAHRVFDDLSEGGTVQMPMGETFFSTRSACASTASASRGW